MALTKRRESAFNPIPSIELNAIFPHRLAAWAKDHGARLITVSTDCVFDGKKGGYTEEDAPNALGHLRPHQGAGRNRRWQCADASAPRSSAASSITGPNCWNGSSPMPAERCKGYRSALYTGITTLYCADLVGDIIERFPHLSGLYQVASRSHYQIRSAMLGSRRISTSTINNRAGRQHDDKTRSERPINFAMPPVYR